MEMESGPEKSDLLKVAIDRMQKKIIEADALREKAIGLLGDSERKGLSQAEKNKLLDICVEFREFIETAKDLLEDRGASAQDVNHKTQTLNSIMKTISTGLDLHDWGTPVESEGVVRFKNRN
jgi:hypothetical protein